jgi:hypothetical protein
LSNLQAFTENASYLQARIITSFPGCDNLILPAIFQPHLLPDAQRQSSDMEALKI